MPDIPSIADIRQRRKDMGMTLADLKRECANRGVKVSENHLSKIENGTHGPRPALWKAIADALSYDPEAEFVPLPHARIEHNRMCTPSPVTVRWLRHHYVTKQWSIQRIADVIGMSHTYTWELIRNSGIPMRNGGQVRKGNVLRKARLDKGMRVKDLADLCGVAVSTISRIERGIYGATKALRLELAKHLEVPESAIPVASREGDRRGKKN